MNNEMKINSIFVLINNSSLINNHLNKMFVIFGFGYKKSDDHQVSKSEHCFHCNNTSQWIASKSREYFSLFFIPVFPYKTTYSYRCPICNRGRKITADEFDKFQSQ